MRQKSGPEKQPAEDAIRDIRRATRRHSLAEEKIPKGYAGRRSRGSPSGKRAHLGSASAEKPCGVSLRALAAIGSTLIILARLRLDAAQGYDIASNHARLARAVSN